MRHPIVPATAALLSLALAGGASAGESTPGNAFAPVTESASAVPGTPALAPRVPRERMSPVMAELHDARGLVVDGVRAHRQPGQVHRAAVGDVGQERLVVIVRHLRGVDAEARAHGRQRRALGTRRAHEPGVPAAAAPGG